MDNKKHNGWTNYATWRVALELFDGASAEDYLIVKEGDDDVSILAERLQEEVNELIDTETTPETFSHSYAMAFLNDVNWYEIAENILTED